MNFKIGDRVISLINDSEGLREGELGTVIEKSTLAPLIRWDEYNPVRHNSGGHTETGHGWYIFSENAISLYQEVNDFGDFQANLAPSSIIELIGG